MLGNHSKDFRVSQKNLAHFSRGGLTLFERERGRHGSANPEITFFQMREKLAAEPQSEKRGRRQEHDANADGERTVIQRKAQRGIVNAVQQTDDYGFSFLDVLREQQGSEHRRDSERR